MVADFSKIGKSVGAHIDAIIGLDVIGATSFTIDFKKRRILFHPSEERHSASFTAGPQFIAIQLKTGNRQLRLLLDTGTSHLVLFRNALHNLDYDWTAVSTAERNISGVASYGTVVLEKATIWHRRCGTYTGLNRVLGTKCRCAISMVSSVSPFSARSGSALTLIDSCSRGATDRNQRLFSVPSGRFRRNIVDAVLSGRRANSSAVELRRLRLWT